MIKVIAITAAVSFGGGFVIGGLTAWSNATDHYQDKAQKLLAAQQEAEDKQAATRLELDRAQFEKYQAAVDKPATIITERVFIRGNCAVPKDAAAAVDDAGVSGRVEIDRETLRGITTVTDVGDRKYQACVAALKYHQQAAQAD